MKKKKFILSLLIILLSYILIYLLFACLHFYKNKINFENSVLQISEKNSDSVFSINNITFFSSCNATTSVKNNSNFTLDNLYQFTDIAIFINNNSSNNEFSAKNTLKEVSINNIHFSKYPSIGTPQLYYKNINNFANPILDEENKIEDTLNFSVTSENNIDYDSPTLYNNCANPITLSYINSNIKSNYNINTSKPITYDGSLLKNCNILLDSISCSISFDIFITNNLNQKYQCPINIDIPLENNLNSIYDGNLITKHTTNYNFYRFE